jgi:hypothetical protein
MSGTISAVSGVLKSVPQPGEGMVGRCATPRLHKPSKIAEDRILWVKGGYF